MKGLAVVRDASAGQWRWVGVGAGYLLGVVVIGYFAFGTSSLFVQGPGGPVRTGTYNARLPIAAPVNPDTIARSITEGRGGPPTIGLPLPEPRPAVAAAPNKPRTAVVLVSKRMIAKTTPAYKAMVKTATNPNWTLLLSLIQSYLRNQPKARPHED